MDTLIEIFETLKALGLCRDQQDFSMNWLAKSRNYFAQLKHSGRRPCVSSIGTLTGKLRSTFDHDHRCRERSFNRRIRSAWIASHTMFLGEIELRYVQPADRVTAIRMV